MRFDCIYDQWLPKRVMLGQSISTNIDILHMFMHTHKHTLTYFKIISIDVGREEIIFIMCIQDHSAVCVWKWIG